MTPAPHRSRVSPFSPRSAILSLASVLALTLPSATRAEEALPAPAPAPGTRSVAVDARTRALQAIHDDAVRRVEALGARIVNLPPGPERAALERQVVELKRQGERDLERARLELTPFADDTRQLMSPAPAPARLENCVDDLSEPNDSCAAAVAMTPGTYSGLVSVLNNDDWYKVTVQRNGTLTVTLAFTNANGDIDMKLFAGCGGAQLASSTTTNNGETFSYKNTGPTAVWDLRIYLFSGTCNSYTMTLAVTSTNDLVAGDTPPGWSAPIVMRSDATASMASATPSATLPGNTASTYLNSASHVVGSDPTPMAYIELSVDDSVLTTPYIPDNGVPGFWYSYNVGPYTVRGGRHTFKNRVDPSNMVVESNETNNTFASQWVWSPLVTAERVPNVRGVPPTRGIGAIANDDGFEFTRASGVAWVVSEAPRKSGDDDDLYVYDDYSGSTSGFSHRIGFSDLGGYNTDFVVGHYSGTPQTVYPAVVLYSTIGGGFPFAIDQADAHGRNGNLALTPAYSWNPVTLPENRLADVYEANMTAGVTYYFSLRLLTGSSPLAFEVFPATTGGVYGRGGGTTSVAVSNFDTLAYTPSSSGWHPVVVYRENGGTADTPLTYDFEWSSAGIVGVPDPTARVSVLEFAGVRPNPMRDAGRFEFALPAAAHVSLALYDVSGRRVRSLADARFEPGQHVLDWDGRSESGERAGAGVYWARLESEGRVLVRRVALVR